jgi:hypothetical protein
VAYDGNEEPRINEIPEVYPETFQGAAGLSTKDIFRQKASANMFGEKTSDGLEYGAKHIHNVDGSPNPAALNTAFMQASHWFEPDDPTPRPYSQEEIEQAQAAADQAEESRRHMLYQQYASYGAASGYGEDGNAGQEQAEWESQYGERPVAAEEPPMWARPPPQQTSSPPTMPPREARQAAREREQAQEAVPESPVDRVPPGQRHRQTMQTMGRPPWNDGSSSSSRPAPALFEKGSFAHRKLQESTRAGSGETPLSGRSSSRSNRAGMGNYANFAARLAGAESNRSQRSARSYRG